MAWPVTRSLNLPRIAAFAVLAAAAALLALLLFREPAPAPPPAAAPETPLASLITVRSTAVAAPKPAPTPAATAAPAPVMEVKRILPIASIEFGKWAWDEAGAPAGPVVMTVDLKAQTMSVFRGGHEIGTAAVLYGANDKPTPLGTHRVIWKKRDHRSSLYDAPMPYTLRLTNDGVAIHGADIRYGMATHGCIGVPLPFAAKLFEAAKLGDVVVVTRGKLLKLGDRIA